MILKKATLHDIPALQKICTTAYANNFYHNWNENGLEWYLEREFGNERLKADLANRNLAYYFIEYNQNPAGFVKIRYNAEINGLQNNAAELEKILFVARIPGERTWECCSR